MIKSMVLSLLAMVLLGIAGASGAEGPGAQLLVSNTFFDSDLKQALMDVAADVGVVIIATPEVSGYITCELNDVPLDQALDIMLAGTGFVHRDLEGYILVAPSDPHSASFLAVSDTRIIRLNYLKAEVARSLLPEPMQGYVIAHGNNHQLAVTAPAPMLDAIAAQVARIDERPRQVMLQARIVVLQQSGAQRLGESWTWPTLSAGANTDNGTWETVRWVGTAGLSTAGELSNALNVQLDFLQSNDEAMTISNPRVLASEGKEAQMSVLTEEYFKILTEDYYQRSTLEKVETGIQLKITPTIGNNGDVSLDIATEISDVVSRGEDDLPVVTRRTTSSRAVVPDRGTIVISGLTDNRQRTSGRRVPLLGSIPLLGNLFRFSQTDRTRSQVVVFITPKLVEGIGPDPAARPAGGRPLPLAGEDFREDIRNLLTKGGHDDHS